VSSLTYFDTVCSNFSNRFVFYRENASRTQTRSYGSVSMRGAGGKQYKPRLRARLREPYLCEQVLESSDLEFERSDALT